MLKQKKFRAIFVLLMVVVLSVGVFTWVSLGNPKPTPTLLQVLRPENPFRRTIPLFEKRITDATAVQRLYTTALALPEFRSFGTYSCGNDTGEIYQLTFLNGTTKIKTMELQVSGCQLLIIDTGKIFPSQDTRQPRLAKIDFYALFSHTIGFASEDNL